MVCITPYVLLNFLIWLVVVIALIAIVQVLLPKLLALLGSPDGGMILQVVRIIVWALVMIAVIYFVFDLLACSNLFRRLT